MYPIGIISEINTLWFLLPFGNTLDYTKRMKQVKVLNQKIKKIGINHIAKLSGLNKSTISRYVNHEREYSLENFEKIKSAVKVFEQKNLRGYTSAREATYRVYLGEDWRIPYFDFVDSFFTTQSELLLIEKPVDGLNIKSLALICAIVMQLCEDVRVMPPEWATLSIELEEPWFLSKFKNLRAISLVESPLFFKRNNIFIGNDFLQRA
jgi:transcriptional regulator with XRE-family HTH domain